MSKGELILKVIEARLERDTETFGQMDPIVELSYGDQSFKTTEKIDAGQHPVWNENFTFEIKETMKILQVKILDVNPMRDDIVGFSDIQTSELCVNGLDAWFDILY